MKTTPIDPNFDFSQTKSIETFSGKQIWKSGTILRKVPKNISKTETDVVIPIHVFYDPETGKILDNLLPPTLRPLVNPTLPLAESNVNNVNIEQLNWENSQPQEETNGWGNITQNPDTNHTNNPQPPHQEETNGWGDTSHSEDSFPHINWGN